LRDPIFDDRFLKALAGWEAERVASLPVPLCSLTAAQLNQSDGLKS
jgi:hypothetical protein